MKIKLSRHSKNNIRLYEITVAEIEECISNPLNSGTEGECLIAYKVFTGRFNNLPLKVVYVTEQRTYFIITAYPLRKSYWR